MMKKGLMVQVDAYRRNIEAYRQPYPLSGSH
jgi:hypothetical protein